MIARLFSTDDPEPIAWRVPMISRAALAATYLATALNLHAAAPPLVFGGTVFQARFGAVPDGTSESGDAIHAASGAELRRNGPAILIERSSHITLNDNAVSDLRPSTTAAIEISPSVAPAEDGVRVPGLDAQLESQSQSILDRCADP